LHSYKKQTNLQKNKLTNKTKMKFYVKEFDQVFKRRDGTYVTNVNVDEIIETLLSFRTRFGIINDIKFVRGNVCEFLNKLKDKNTVVRYFSRESALQFIQRNIPYTNSETIGHGMFSLTLDISDDKSIDGMYLEFYRSNLHYIIFSLVYNNESETYRPLY